MKIVLRKVSRKRIDKALIDSVVKYTFKSQQLLKDVTHESPIVKIGQSSSLTKAGTALSNFNSI